MAERITRSLGVRWRTTLIAVLVVGAALGAGTSALLRLTSDRIESSIEEAAVARADSIVALAAAGAVEDPLSGRDPELLAQVVDGSGVVIAADRAIAGVPPLADVLPAVGEEQLLVLDDILEGFEDEAAGLEDQGPYAVAAHGVMLDGGPGVVIVASSLEDAAEARNAVLPLLGVGLPALLVLVGLIVWLLTGRALRPVKEMSAEAGRISALALDRRLPLPMAQDELHHLAETLNDMLDRLEASAIQRNRFVSDASHELKSPLAAIRTMVDVAGADGSVDAELTEDLRGEIDRMQALVSDLLFLARHDEAALPARTEEVDLDMVAVTAMRGLAGELHIDSTGITPARVIGDPDGLEQMVRNLVENATRHASGGVWIETAESGGVATVTVSDDGPGIPAGDTERVLERFVRLDASRARGTGGTGLGLAVARAIARDHGGELKLGESIHRGATFVASLPTAGPIPGK